MKEFVVRRQSNQIWEKTINKINSVKGLTGTMEMLVLQRGFLFDGTD